MIGTSGTKLKDRILWFDGDSSYKPQALYDLLLSGRELDSSVFVTELTTDVNQFNRLVPESTLGIKSELREIVPEWTIPDKYKELNVRTHVLNKLLVEIDKSSFNEHQIDDRITRVENEIKLYEKYNLVDILKVVIYIVDEFEKNGIVWGTGRGSSCCSYCLYLIGIHDVDSVEYDLDLTEFFR